MTSPLKTRVIEEWETVAVTALPPGWSNLYRDRNGGPVVSACPAILLQQLHTRVHYRIQPDGEAIRERVEKLSAPYDTRAVFADGGGCGELTVAAGASNYAGTVGPDEPRTLTGEWL